MPLAAIFCYRNVGVYDTIRGMKVMLDAVCYDLNPFRKGSSANFHRAISQNCPTIRLESVVFCPVGIHIGTKSCDNSHRKA